jgi:hypothetical protein
MLVTCTAAVTDVTAATVIPFLRVKYSHNPIKKKDENTKNKIFSVISKTILLTAEINEGYRINTAMFYRLCSPRFSAGYDHSI